MMRENKTYSYLSTVCMYTYMSILYMYVYVYLCAYMYMRVCMYIDVCTICTVCMYEKRSMGRKTNLLLLYCSYAHLLMYL